MDQFWDELDSGEIHLRDKWQFELKSEFSPKSTLPKNTYVQEFFLFIPNALQINKRSYTKSQFYEDQTNLIRYKTPAFSFDEILDKKNVRSPLSRVAILCDKPMTPQNDELLEEELKLLANVIRSTLRSHVKDFLEELKKKIPLDLVITQVNHLCDCVADFRTEFSLLKDRNEKKWKDPLAQRKFIYIDEFISNSISNYLATLLESLRLMQKTEFDSIDQRLFTLLAAEKKFRQQHFEEPSLTKSSSEKDNEYILYRNSLLNKYVLDVLLLNTNRFSFDDRYQNWIGAFSAGIAMLVYFSLFIWLGSVFVFTSEPFILLTVIIYMLKDRLKEWVKSFSYQSAFKWFSDYKTDIQSQDQKDDLGKIKESFAFVEEERLPKEIRETRNREFHAILETFQRPESVLYYKRKVEINRFPQTVSRRHKLNFIFRFNIYRFLLKASDPTETYISIDEKSGQLISMRLPKVYHLNVILKNTFLAEDNSVSTELQKLRLVIDKNGIKRIESI